MTLKIGDKRQSKKFGEVVIIGVSKDKVVVRFLNTGNEQELRKDALCDGGFSDAAEREKMLGRKPRPSGSWVVGEILPSNNWGDFKVIAVHGSRLDIQFLLTGNTKNVRTYCAAEGSVMDTVSRANGGSMLNSVSPSHVLAKIPSGTMFKSNCWGNVEVLEYISSTEIKVSFTESGNMYTVQKDALEKGLVKDLERQKQETSARRAKEKVAAEFNRRLKEHSEHIEKINFIINRAHYRREKEELRQSIKAAKEFNMAAILTHERYGDYQIIDNVGRRCTIRFSVTGSEFNTTVTAAKAGRVRDFSQFSKDAEKELNRQRSADNYLANRERRLQAAKDWQKANPEKCRARNNNRRAKRLSAEGTFTVEESNALLVAQNHKCNSCGVCLNTYEKNLDHIMPLDLGGSNWIENLQWLCQYCNNSKSAKHPDDWAKEILTDTWQERRKQML